MRNFLYILLLVCPTYLAAAIQLQYLPFVRVQQTNRIVMDVQESQPILNMSTQGNQTVMFDLVASSPSPVKNRLSLPATLTMTIKDVSIRVKANGQEASFDPRHATNSPSLKEFTHLINRPLSLGIDLHGQVVTKGDTFERLVQDHPALSELSLDYLVKDLVFGLFALCDEDLSVGAKIEMQSTQGPVFSLPAFVTYEIAQITDKEVVATLTGKVGQRKIILEKPIQVNGNRSQKVEMTVSGTIAGKASWQRSNAMLYGLTCDYCYDAKLQSGNLRWSMQTKISQTITSCSP